MNKYPEKPILSETDNQYLLKIHPAQKERAKGIEGRKWDANRQCWVYPKIQRVYNSLIAEFGDDLTIVQRDLVITHPNSVSAVVETSKPGITKAQMEKSQAEMTKLRSELASRETELQNSHQHLLSKDAEISKISRELKEKKIEVETLQLELRSKKSTESLETIFKDVAIDATSNDRKFRILLERLTLDSMAPLKIVNELTEELRQWLDKRGQNSSGDLFDLLSTAKECELLSQGALDLAQTIRRQRNVVAHDRLHEKTILPRVLVCLFSAALLWPELPE